MPKISVIVPVYKVEQYLNRCVDSILGQTYCDFELILVDDGSPDSCGAICDQYAQKDSRVHVIHQANGGLSAARNAGIDWAMENSGSKYLTFIDSDDWVHRDYLAVLYNGLAQSNAAMSMCYLKCVDGEVEDGELRQEPCILDAETAFAEEYTACMSACTKLYDKSLFRELRFPVGKLHEDAYVTHLLLFAAGTVALIREYLYYYYSNPGSITRVTWSPRRLDEIEAHERRLEFFQAQHLQQAYIAEQWAHTCTILAQLSLLDRLCRKERSYRPYARQLRKKLMPHFRACRKRGQIPWAKENIWRFELAYPIKPVWYGLYLLRKLRGRT